MPNFGINMMRKECTSKVKHLNKADHFNCFFCRSLRRKTLLGYVAHKRSPTPTMKENRKECRRKKKEQVNQPIESTDVNSGDTESIESQDIDQ